MNITDIAFNVTDWASIEKVEHAGVAGKSYWQTQYFGEIRVRLLEYTPGYIADHWCVKGHVLFCLAGELHTELQDGRQFILTPGMSYQVADNAEAHKSSTPSGALLFVVD